MNLREAHEKCVTGDRELLVKLGRKSIISGYWFQDHILDFVSSHENDAVEIISDNVQQITVQMVR